MREAESVWAKEQERQAFITETLRCVIEGGKRYDSQRVVCILEKKHRGGDEKIIR